MVRSVKERQPVTVGLRWRVIGLLNHTGCLEENQYMYQKNLQTQQPLFSDVSQKEPQFVSDPLIKEP